MSNRLNSILVPTVLGVLLCGCEFEGGRRRDRLEGTQNPYSFPPAASNAEPVDVRVTIRKAPDGSPGQIGLENLLMAYASSLASKTNYMNIVSTDDGTAGQAKHRLEAKMLYFDTVDELSTETFNWYSVDDPNTVALGIERRYSDDRSKKRKLRYEAKIQLALKQDMDEKTSRTVCEGIGTGSYEEPPGTTVHTTGISNSLVTWAKFEEREGKLVKGMVPGKIEMTPKSGGTETRITHDVIEMATFQAYKDMRNCLESKLRK